MDYVRLSKTIAHALRHDPQAYGLSLDDEGWTPVEALLAALRGQRREWRDLSEADLRTMMGQAGKQRYEMAGGRIRARYGHSLPGKVAREPAVPPRRLYHGTAPALVETILTEGLKPMQRQIVHLSTDTATARQVGARHADHPAVLEIDAAEAHAAGVPFYQGNDNTWLADAVPPRFITRLPG